MVLPLAVTVAARLMVAGAVKVAPFAGEVSVTTGAGLVGVAETWAEMALGPLGSVAVTTK